MQQEFESKYEVGKLLGTGAFSDVMEAMKRDTNEKVAIKIIDRAKCKGKEDMLETEVRILTLMDHPNIVKLYEKFEFDNKIFLVMELVKGGELFDEIVSRGSFPERDASRVIDAILGAIKYLHDMGIVHRDLKPENLLLNKKDGALTSIKISDFGLSKIYNQKQVMKTACGTPGYVAPEVLRRNGYGLEVDLWSLGVITYILLCGYPPFYDAKNPELFKKIIAGKFQFDHPWWDHISDKAKDFVKRLLVVDHGKRMTAAEALNHPFIVSYREKRVVTSAEAAVNTNSEVMKPLQPKSKGEKSPEEILMDSIETIRERNSIVDPLKAKINGVETPIILSNIHIDPHSSHTATKRGGGLSQQFHKITNWFKAGAVSSEPKNKN